MFDRRTLITDREANGPRRGGAMPLRIALAALLSLPAAASAQRSAAQSSGGLVFDSQTLSPNEYVVQEGDTLSAICGLVFNNPYVWPAVWALNPHITNPHWIYPGDVIRLRRQPRQSNVLGASAPQRYAPSQVYFVSESQATQGVVNIGYIATEDDEKPLGKIIASPAQNLWLTDSNKLYVQFEDLDAVQLGQRYTVYREDKAVRHPKSDSLEEMGKKIRVLGVVEIVRVDEKVATGRMVKTYSEVERGALVGPLQEHHRYVSPQQNLIDLEGYIVERARSMTLLGESELLFIDRGAEDGVQVGNRFAVLRRGDGNRDLDEEILEMLPWEEIGELLVVDTRPGTSTVLVTRSERDLKIGDRVEMRRNY